MNTDDIDSTDRVNRAAWEDDWRVPAVESVSPLDADRAADGTRTKLGAAPPPIPVAALRKMARPEDIEDLATPVATFGDEVQPTTPFKRAPKEYGIDIDDVQLPPLQDRGRTALPAPRRGTSSHPVTHLVGDGAVTFGAPPVDALAKTAMSAPAARFATGTPAPELIARPAMPPPLPATGTPRSVPMFGGVPAPMTQAMAATDDIGAPPALPATPLALAQTMPPLVFTPSPVMFEAAPPMFAAPSRPASQMAIAEMPDDDLEADIAPLRPELAPKIAIAAAAAVAFVFVGFLVAAAEPARRPRRRRPSRRSTSPHLSPQPHRSRHRPRHPRRQLSRPRASRATSSRARPARR